MASSSSSAPTRKSAIPTRERLLAAASEVFAARGLMAATTREIAQAAQVNEVTLFRLFGHKQNLLAAVIARVFAAAPAEAPAEGDGSLRALVTHYAEFYRARLERNMRLIRVLIGEIQHCDEQAKEVVYGVFHPQRQEFIERLRAAQQRGGLQADADPLFVADQLSGMILTRLLKNDLPGPRRSSAARYVESCIEIIVRAYAAPVAKPPGGKR